MPPLINKFSLSPPWFCLLEHIRYLSRKKKTKQRIYFCFPDKNSARRSHTKTTMLVAPTALSSRLSEFLQNTEKSKETQSPECGKCVFNIEVEGNRLKGDGGIRGQRADDGSYRL